MNFLLNQIYLITSPSTNSTQRFLRIGRATSAQLTQCKRQYKSKLRSIRRTKVIDYSGMDDSTSINLNDPDYVDAPDQHSQKRKPKKSSRRGRLTSFELSKFVGGDVDIDNDDHYVDPQKYQWIYELQDLDPVSRRGMSACIELMYPTIELQL